MVNLFLDPLFGACEKNHRENIRKHIVENHELTDLEKLCILDLNQLPKSENYFFSIAHCKTMGGYAVSDRALGFDIEELERIQPETVKRISAQDSYPEDVRYLWPAKESLVKLTSANLASDCRITKWVNNDFEAIYQNTLLCGSISLFEKYIIAISFFKNLEK